MKSLIAVLSALAFIGLSVSARCQTLNWGSSVFSDLADSKGDTLDETFVFELGAFESDFVPTESNTHLWIENWRVFDQAAYDSSIGYFTSSVRVLDDGTSDSAHLSPNAPSFEGLGAYLWIRNGDEPLPGTEWLLARADNWVFPMATPGCCDNEGVIEWSVSDLDGDDVPVFGGHGGVSGGGFHEDSEFHTLQTYTFVPEPASVLLLVSGIAAAGFRRRRVMND